MLTLYSAAYCIRKLHGSIKDVEWGWFSVSMSREQMRSNKQNTQNDSRMIIESSSSYTHLGHAVLVFYPLSIKQVRATYDRYRSVLWYGLVEFMSRCTEAIQVTFGGPEPCSSTQFTSK